jgi:hypothetical protein
MSRTHGWYPKPKYSTAGLKVSQEDWDRIFKKRKLPPLLRNRAPYTHEDLTKPSEESKENS